MNWKEIGIKFVGGLLVAYGFVETFRVSSNKIIENTLPCLSKIAYHAATSSPADFSPCAWHIGEPSAYVISLLAIAIGITLLATNCCREK